MHAYNPGTTLHIRTLHSACDNVVHGHVQDHIIKPIDNTYPVGTGEYVYIYTYVFYKKKEAHMQKRHNEDIIMYYYDRHFVVVDV